MSPTKKKPLYLAILWHMHQPLYKDAATGEYILPWVRLHTLKDYYDIPALLNDYSNIKQVFNLVPSLLMQLDDYKHDSVKDRFLQLTVKAAAELSVEDKVFLLKNFFLANWDHMIKPYPRYWELLQRRGPSLALSDLYQVQSLFAIHDYRDLQVWFNLAWSGNTLMADPVLRKLIRKGAHFSEEDKQRLLARQQRLLSETVPLYIKLEQRGQIEISTTPYYHPILPLLCSTKLGQVSDSRTPLPRSEFHYPQDADRQIQQAVAFHEQLFGHAPAGLWPSEGAVADEIIPLIRRHGVQWIATDEEILRRSLGQEAALTAAQLYQPYQITQNGHRLAIFFRDHALSDRIGFVYSKWSGRDAAQDLIAKLHNIRAALPDDQTRYIVSIILDGENAWEYYPKNAKEFLTSFYELLAADPYIKTVTYREFLQQEKDRVELGHLHPGSWIDGNFRTWIGHAEKNRAWELLCEARGFLESNKKRANEKAWEAIFMAEGSDWFWWYGDDHASETAAELDYLFRRHLKNVYYFMGERIPTALDQPIKQISTNLVTLKHPTGLLRPTIDGKVSHFFEWEFAGCFRAGAGQGSMHQADRLVKEIYFGYDPNTLYLRVDAESPARLTEATSRRIEFLFQSPTPKRLILDLAAPPTGPTLTLESADAAGPQELGTVRVGKIVEMALPIAALGIADGNTVEFTLAVFQGENELERWPRPGVISFSFSPSELEQSEWSV
ncbi:MAG: glycoside hydrolase [Acidobacteria bacterium]|nr:glycoside hydrolase [Acidobacteriota bacterium]MBI3656889.1 glycoside hydrolase [Acidobacteriota bacterium]